MKYFKISKYSYKILYNYVILQYCIKQVNIFQLSKYKNNYFVSNISSIYRSSSRRTSNFCFNCCIFI